MTGRSLSSTEEAAMSGELPDPIVRFCPRCYGEPGHYLGDGRWTCLVESDLYSLRYGCGYWHQGRPLVGDDSEPHPLDADGVRPEDMP